MVQPSFLLIGVATTVKLTHGFLYERPLISQTEAISLQGKHTCNDVLKMTASLSEDEELSAGSSANMIRNRQQETSTAIPFLARPPVLRGELAGDVGFDPLGLAKNKESLYSYREAEIKHARLAMLAAAGWPLSELLDKKIASLLSLTPIVDVGDRAPSLLNGGLDRVPPAWWGFCLGMAAAIDLYGVSRARDFATGENKDYIPGDLNFDPLGLYPPSSDGEGRKRMQLAEIKHGRVAMLAVTGYSFQEAVSGIGVVDETPFLFFPATKLLLIENLLDLEALGLVSLSTKTLLDNFLENFGTYSLL